MDPINKNIKGKVSDLNIDYSQGVATFSFNAHDLKTKKKILGVQEVKVDLDIDGLSPSATIDVSNVDITLTKETLNNFQSAPSNNQTESTKDSKKKNELPPLGFLKRVTVTDVDLKLPDANLHGSLDKLNLQFENGRGSIGPIKLIYGPQNLQVIDIEKIALGFSKEFFTDENKDIAVNILKPNFKISQEVINAIQDYVPDQRQAQTEESEKSKQHPSPASPISMLKMIGIQDFNLILVGPSHFEVALDQIDINFQEGQGRVSQISAGTKETSLLKVPQIAIGFNPEVLYGKGTAELKVDVNGTYINVDPTVISQLKNHLPQTSAPKEERSNRPSILTHVSRVSIDNTDVRLKKQGINAWIKSIDLKMEKGSLIASNITSSIAGEKKRFLLLEEVSASFSLKELSEPKKPDLAITVSDLHVDVSKELMNKFKSKEKSQNKTAKGPPTLPLKISKILVSNSSVAFINYPGIGPQEHLTIKEIFGAVYDITLEPGTPLSSFAFNATFEGDSKLITKGQLDLADTRPQWSADFKLFNLDMTKLNEELRKRVPITFNEGVLDFYGEAIQTDDKIVGYYKPVLKDAEYIGNEGDFKGPRHFAAEMFGRFTNWLFERDETDTVATRVPFEVKEGKLDTKVGEAAWKAVEHGLLETDPVNPRVEKKYRLKQAEEEKQ